MNSIQWISFHIEHSLRNWFLSQTHCQCNSTVQAYDWLEFFAGHAACTCFARLQGFKGCKFDLKYNSNNRVPPRKSNYMDVNSPSGFVQPGSNYTFTFFLSFYISYWVGNYE